jgi:CRISPR-associated protein Csb2
LAGAPPARHYAAFRVATLDGERWKPFPVRKAFKLAAWLRAAAAQRLAATGFDHVSIERRVFGHGATDTDAPHRLAFLPLPSIGHGHVDGQVRRILIAEPFGGDGRFERELAFGLNGEVLRPDDPARAVLLAAPEPEDERMVRRYVAPSRCWQTVTPVILPGHDDCGRKTSKVLKKALVEAGLAGFPLEGIRHQREPFIPGTEHASLYELPDYLRRYPCVHVELKFREPVPGPLCIGGGRFLGLGLLCNRS